MIPNKTSTFPFLAEDFLSDQNVDRADRSVAEVFACMLGLELVPCPPSPLALASEERTAIIGYSGAMRGYCELQMNTSSAVAVASAMLGGLPVEDDESLDDAVGEICNMIAGSWRDRVPSLISECALTPPTVITGRDYKLHMSRPSVRLTRCYRFTDGYVSLTLRRECSIPR